MAKTTKKQAASKEVTPVVTRAEKKDATKNLIKECLAVKPHKHNELLDAVATLYVERFGGEDSDNINDVKGRVGSVLDIMKKDSDIMYEGGMYALKARMMPEPAQQSEEKPVKKTTKKASTKKKEEPIAEEVKEEKPAKKTPKAKKKAEPAAEKIAEDNARQSANTDKRLKYKFPFLPNQRKNPPFLYPLCCIAPTIFCVEAQNRQAVTTAAIPLKTCSFI